MKVELDQVCSKHMFDIPFLKLQIEDAFVSSFNLRNFETSRYFLENGFEFNEHIEDAVISLAYSLEYLIDPKEAPLLQYGANPRYCESVESNTALHLACQAGNLQFCQLLVEYGADINAVNDNKETPLGLAKKHNRKLVVDYLKSKNASAVWNE